MAELVRRLRVFCASPGDVSDERSLLARVVQDVNLALEALAPGTAVLDLIRWETHVHPGLGSPQSVINDQIPDYDIFIGMMWNRFGTPTENAGSGTEEEFRRAYERWSETGSPQVMFYFSKAPTSVKKEDLGQLEMVLNFEEELSKKGLVKTYPDRDGYEALVRRDLLLLVGRLLQRDRGDRGASDRWTAGEASADVAREFSETVHQLAGEYEKTREDMDSGPERTREMEKLASRMRTLAGDAYPLLDEFTRDPSAGVRLAAITFLQTFPNVEYLDWLAGRLSMGVEKPFVGYHAAVALLSAARAVGEGDLGHVEQAIESAVRLLGDHPTWDRYTVLQEALGEVERRRSKRPDH